MQAAIGSDRDGGRPPRHPSARAALLLLFVLGIPAAAETEPPAPTEPPAAPTPSETPAPPAPPAPPAIPADARPLARGFDVDRGQTHKGNVYVITPGVRIDGKLDGDLFAAAATARIRGETTGDVMFVGRSFELSGKVEDAVRVWAGEVKIDGTVEGEVLASGGKVVVGPKARLRGDASFYASEIVVEGEITGDLHAAGGKVVLGGKVGGDVDVQCDHFVAGPEIRIGGDFAYAARKRMIVPDLDERVAGAIDFNDRSEKPEAESAPPIKVQPTRSGSGGFAPKIFAFFAATLVGLLALRTFRNAAPTVAGFVSADPLKSLGVGFLTVLASIAAVFAIILIVTIPLVLIFWLLVLIAFYLGKIPVGLRVGRFALEKLGRAGVGDGWALVAGLVILYLAFSIPWIGTWVWALVSLLGMGAILLGAREYRLARRSGNGAVGRPAPPAPSPPPSAPGTEGSAAPAS